MILIVLFGRFVCSYFSLYGFFTLILQTVFNVEKCKMKNDQKTGKKSEEKRFTQPEFIFFIYFSNVEHEVLVWLRNGKLNELDKNKKITRI